MWGGLFTILPCFYAIYHTGIRINLSLDWEVAWVWHTNTEENRGSLIECSEPVTQSSEVELVLGDSYREFINVQKNSVDTIDLLHVLVNS